MCPNNVAKYSLDFTLTVVKEDEVKEFLFPLEVRKIPGVDPKTERSLKELGIETVADLASMKPEMLRLFVYGAQGCMNLPTESITMKSLRNTKQNL